MVGIVIVTHCNLSSAFLEVVKEIAQKIDYCEGVGINPQERGEEKSLQTIIEAIKKVDQGDGVLLLTDMFGGTPTNLCLSLLEEGNIEVLTGINLPIILKLATIKERHDIKMLGKMLKEYGQQNICFATEMLEKKPGKKES
ncbi:MAG: PTS sugar transporter subunit IIA [Thermodesulfobacteriota bacterium]|nr:PTS sugar transporter subunit IIA [Thermodesulfobacteriota bacterium]